MLTSTISNMKIHTLTYTHNVIDGYNVSSDVCNAPFTSISKAEKQMNRVIKMLLANGWAEEPGGKNNRRFTRGSETFFVSAMTQDIVTDSRGITMYDKMYYAILKKDKTK